MLEHYNIKVTNTNEKKNNKKFSVYGKCFEIFGVHRTLLRRRRRRRFSSCRKGCFMCMCEWEFYIILLLSMFSLREHGFMFMLYLTHITVSLSPNAACLLACTIVYTTKCAGVCAPKSFLRNIYSSSSSSRGLNEAYRILFCTHDVTKSSLNAAVAIDDEKFWRKKNLKIFSVTADSINLINFIKTHAIYDIFLFW